MQRRVIAAALLIAGTAVAMFVGGRRTEAVRAGGHERIALVDDCDPTDPGWTPTGGCALKEGDVRVNEFFALLTSPLSLSTVGHPAWRFQPSYLKVEPDESVRVTNEGGRLHTFTEVVSFGGGRVPALNVGLTAAPECLNPNIVGPTEVPPGARLEVKGLGVGNHSFQCCIHPWMRALIKVKAEED
jgi:plastocyanin